MPSLGRARGHHSTLGNSSGPSLNRTRGRGALFAEPTPSKKNSSITERPITWIIFLGYSPYSRVNLSRSINSPPSARKSKASSSSPSPCAGDHQIRDRLDDPCHLSKARLPDQRPQGQDLLEDRNRHQKQIMGGGRNTRLWRRKYVVGKWRRHLLRPLFLVTKFN
jgi:hypothetical protein